MRIWIGIFVVLSISSIAGVSHAFPRHSWFNWSATGQSTDSSLRAGGGGIFGTGGQQDYGIKCSHCHINDKKQQGHIKLVLNVSYTSGGAKTGWPKKGGVDSYVPGTTYTISAVMMGEHLGGIINGVDNGDANGMVLTIEDANGKLAGTLTSDSGQSSANAACSTPAGLTDPFPYVINGGTSYPAGKTTVIFGDCHAVMSLDQISSPSVAITSWTFTWTAPAAGAGPLTIFYGAVDGNYDAVSSLGDDVTELAIALDEGP